MATLAVMVEALLELVVAPGLVGAATLAARRWDERVGGVVSAFPAIVGPVLLIAALEHGAAFAGRAASGTLLGLVALSGFAVAYGRVARTAGWLVSLAAGWAAAGVLGVTAGALALAPVAALGAAAVSVAAAHRALGAPEPDPRDPGAATAAAEGHSAVRLPAVAAWDLPARMALTALLVLALTATAGRFGAVVGGMLAALPVLASVLAAFTHAQCGPRALAELLRGMLAGMAGFVSFCAVVAVLAQPAGIAAAFTIATAVAVAAQVATAVPFRLRFT
jgi:hypothetical protein